MKILIKGNVWYLKDKKHFLSLVSPSLLHNVWYLKIKKDSYSC